LITVLLVSFWPVLQTIALAQTSLLLTLALLGGYLCLRSHRFGYAGIVLSLLFIKPQYLLLPFVMLLWQKSKSAVKGLVIAVGALLLLSALLITPLGMIGYGKL